MKGEHRVRIPVSEDHSERLKKVTELEAQVRELRKTEEILRRNEQEKQTLLDASIDSIRLVDGNFRILWANRTARDNLGLAPEEIIGQTCYSLFTERDTPCENCPMQKVVETGEREHAILHKPRVKGIEGESYWDCYTVPLKDGSGNIDRLIQITRNVTEKIEAQVGLEKKINELRAINGIMLRLTKEEDLNGIGIVLHEIMGDFYPDSETLIFLINPERNGFHFPKTDRGDFQETCYERARKRIKDRGTEEPLLSLLNKGNPGPMYSGEQSMDWPDAVIEITKGYRGWFAVPMDVEGICHGLFLLGSLKGGTQEEEDLIFIDTLIRQISGVIRYQVSKEIREEAFRKQLTGPDKYMGLVGRSNPMQGLYRMVQAIADSPSTVLITGESGTGKELVARAIHGAGKYHSTPFIPAHCSSFVPTLVHSEIFGHEKGAFTGASKRKRGRLERAEGGILFLDEVADLPLETQVLLLRFLQDKRFERVGGEKIVEVDVRIVAATNKNIEAEMRSGRVREDFYYRLNIIQLEVPPLRERITDLPMLANHFLRTYCLLEGKGIEGFELKAMRLMMDYHWPGNVRELQNVIAKSVVLASDRRIGVNDLPEQIRMLPGAPTDYSLHANERKLIRKVMEECTWNKHKAARVLKISRSTLYSKLKRYNIRAEAGSNIAH